MPFGVEVCNETRRLSTEDELATVKAVLVGVLKVFGGKVTVPMTYLDQYPYSGKLTTLLGEQGMEVYYEEPEGGD